MASHSHNARLGQLWQLPLFLLSMGLFAFAAYLFYEARPKLTLDQEIEVARVLIQKNRAEEVPDYPNGLLGREKMDSAHEAAVHLLIAEALDVAQRQKRVSIAANYIGIIQQIDIAMSLGAQPTGDICRRLGESYEGIDRPTEALANFQKAIGLGSKDVTYLHRKVIDLQLSQGMYDAAEASIEKYVKNNLSSRERAWAMGQRAQLLINRGDYTQARELLGEALKLDAEAASQGELNYRLGYCSWKLGDSQQAERLLRVARDQLRVQHPLDADAAYVLGHIYQDRHDPRQANSYYQDVLVSHPDAPVASMALMGRGLCRIMFGDDDAGLTDLHDLIDQIKSKASRAKYQPQVIEGLREAESLLVAKTNYQGAMEVMAYEQTLQPRLPATFFARLASVYEKRADQLEQSAAENKDRRTQQVREFRAKAGDAYVAYSRTLTMADDHGYGDAMWKGIDLYERAGDIQRTANALETFVSERPDDALAPDAMLRLGRAYQLMGQFDKAIATYQRNQFRYPKSLAASKSAIPLAQAYIAKGPEAYAKAEKVLLGIVDNNPLVAPEAEEFRQAIFELGQLYYRTGRYEEAIARLEEWTQRYPNDDRMGQIYFLMADSYRKSATLLDQSNAVASTVGAPIPIDSAEANAARRDRLNKARRLYDRLIGLYKTNAPGTEIEKLYLKLSHFYRADCLYELGEYEQAIKLYDVAAFRYQEDPSALAAYVQIVNAYCALGKIEEAKTANERAKWLLRRMPANAFQNGGFNMPKAYWEQWLKWSSEAGMW